MKGRHLGAAQGAGEGFDFIQRQKIALNPELMPAMPYSGSTPRPVRAVIVKFAASLASLACPRKFVAPMNVP